MLKFQLIMFDLWMKTSFSDNVEIKSGYLFISSQTNLRNELVNF